MADTVVSEAFWPVYRPSHYGHEADMNAIPEFYSDKDVARILSMSPAWVRGQRHKRRHGEPCTFDLEPRYIGTCARYVREEVEAFVTAIRG